ncbi:unnamed protein product, partial [Didymodactylos carnosus]
MSKRSHIVTRSQPSSVSVPPNEPYYNQNRDTQFYSQNSQQIQRRQSSNQWSNNYCYTPDGSASALALIKPSPLTFITAPVNGIRIKCMLDTGATNTFINKSILDKLRHKPIRKVMNSFILADGGTRIKINGAVEIYIKTGYITTKITALVSSTLCVGCILVKDWIERYRVDVSEYDRKVTVHMNKSTASIKMDDDTDKHVFAVRAASSIILEPQCERIIKVIMPVSIAKAALFQPKRTFQEEKLVVMPHALLSIENYTSYITIANPTNKRCLIPYNTRLGVVSIQTAELHCYAINPETSMNRDNTSDAMPRQLNEPEPQYMHQLNVGSCFSISKATILQHLKDVFKQMVEHIEDQEEKHEVTTMLHKYYKIFDTTKLNISNLKAPPMINTGDNPPISSRAYRTDQHRGQLISRTVNEMVQAGQVKRSYSSWSEHIHHIEELYLILEHAKLTLNPPKCSIVQTEISYLGHTINRYGVKPLAENVEAIVKIKMPTSAKDVHSFVQAANYYRDHIPNFAKIAAPLYKFTKKNAQFHPGVWTDKEKQAFNDLKIALTTSPLMLDFPDESSMVLSTDASGIGMDGVLRQMTPDGPKVIKYLS